MEKVELREGERPAQSHTEMPSVFRAEAFPPSGASECAPHPGCSHHCPSKQWSVALGRQNLPSPWWEKPGSFLSWEASFDFIDSEVGKEINGNIQSSLQPSCCGVWEGDLPTLSLSVWGDGRGGGDQIAGGFFQASGISFSRKKNERLVAHNCKPTI